jgi:pilus assembly protein CpaE
MEPSIGVSVPSELACLGESRSMSVARSPLVILIISPRQTVLSEIQAGLAGAPVDSVWTLQQYPEPGNLDGLKVPNDGRSILFLDFVDTERAMSLADAIDRVFPGITIVAVAAKPTTEDLLKLMRAGIREVLPYPFLPRQVQTALARSVRHRDRDAGGTVGHGEVYAFVAAKRGSGATTLAIHTAAAAARLSNWSTLLLDLDLRMGLTSFLLKLDGTKSIADALERAHGLDRSIWEKLVSQKETLDILASGPDHHGGRIAPGSYEALLSFVRTQYQTVIVDLPGTFHPHEVHTLQEAAEIFLICTPDLPGLHMARRQADLLRGLNLRGCVSTVVNFAGGRGALSLASIEQIVTFPVRLMIPRDEKLIADAVENGDVVRGRSPFARQVEMLAKKITAATAQPNGLPIPLRRKFVEYFSISAARCSDQWQKARRRSSDPYQIA